MRCARCEGLMVLEEFDDFELGSSAAGCLCRRCINCGAIVDPVIAIHQLLTSVRQQLQSADTRGPDPAEDRRGDAPRMLNDAPLIQKGSLHTQRGGLFNE